MRLRMHNVDIEIRGANGLRDVGAAVRRLGSDRTIVNEMAREIRGAVPPIRSAIKASALTNLPHRGGLNVWVSKMKVNAQIRRGAQNAGVSLKGSKAKRGKKHDMRSLNRGFIRHPLWGNRDYWYSQTVSPRFMTDAVTDEGVDAFRHAVVVATDRAIARII
jgi:hypothetical protein